MENQNVIGKNIKRLRQEIGLSQEELGRCIGVTKSTISQWELGKAFPKPKNIVKLAEQLNVARESIEHDSYTATVKQHKLCEDGKIKLIPFYSEVRASTGHGQLNPEERYELIHIKDLPAHTALKNLFCILTSGDSMEPVLNHGSLMVFDTTQRNIVDGKMYVFGQEGALRVKVFSYEKSGVKLTSYNKNYSDEFYRFDELNSLRVLGKVVFHSTKID
jgi:phage repressor protein C with HTH and peptisase S24 domain